MIFNRGDRVRVIQPLSEFFGKEFEVAWQDNAKGVTVYTPSKGSWRTLIWTPTGYLEKVNEPCNYPPTSTRE